MWFEIFVVYDNKFLSFLVNLFCSIGLFFVTLTVLCSLILAFSFSSDYVKFVFYLLFSCSVTCFVIFVIYVLSSFLNLKNAVYRASNYSCSPDLQSLVDKESITG